MCNVTWSRSHIGEGAKSRGAHNRIHGDVQKSMACSQALGTKHDRRLHILTLSVIAL